MPSRWSPPATSIRACRERAVSRTASAGLTAAGPPICSNGSRFAPPMAMFSVRFLGCKVSHADAQALRERLLAEGHEERAGAVDVAVVNGCCVTNEAVAKSRQAAARAARTHRRVYVTGCAANLAGDALATLPANVAVIRATPEQTPGLVARDVGPIGCVQADARLDRVRAFVKVQDGCSFSCAFCVIPLVRGASRSRRAPAVLAEIEKRVRQGHREVVLTGINLGCFRDRDAGFTLARLIREAGAGPRLGRLWRAMARQSTAAPSLRGRGVLGD